MNAYKFTIVQNPHFDMQTLKQPQELSAVKNPTRLSIKCKYMRVSMST